MDLKLKSVLPLNQIRQAQDGHVENYRSQRRELQRMTSALLRGIEVNEFDIQVIPDCVDDPVCFLPEKGFKPKVLLQCEDFGGNLTAPFYVDKRPSIDYYASNLLIHMFVIANVSDNVNHIYLYDERGGGKGANEMCPILWAP